MPVRPWRIHRKASGSSQCCSLFTAPSIYPDRRATNEFASNRLGLLRQEFLPQVPLHAPVKLGGNRLKFMQDDVVAAALHTRQKQNVFLDVGSQMQEIHDLADAGPSDVAQASEYGLVRNDAVLKES